MQCASKSLVCVEESAHNIQSMPDIDASTARTNADITVILPNGFGYGEGNISVQSQITAGEISSDSLREALEIIENEHKMFCSTDSHVGDDGCGDGRATGVTYKVLDTTTGHIERYRRPLRRAKIFGGGLVVASSMWRTVVGADTTKTLRDDREYIAGILKQHGIAYGAHTAADVSDVVASGCGAIDNYERITRNAIIYKMHILRTLHLIYGNAFDDNRLAVDQVFQEYEMLTDRYFDGMNGRQTLQFIESQGAIIKELTGEHKEDVVIINDIEETTFDQEALRRTLHHRGLSPDIQAFVVDLWRGRMYAEFIADRVAELGHGREESYRRAYADFLIRTLAVSATLTAGDQPVILRSAQN